MFYNRQEAATLEMGMAARQSSIPPAERCKHCDGKGMVRIGCAMTHAIYSICGDCDGTGCFSEEREKIRKRIEELKNRM